MLMMRSDFKIILLHFNFITIIFHFLQIFKIKGKNKSRNVTNKISNHQMTKLPKYEKEINYLTT